MPLDAAGLRIARDRITRVFRYLEALNQHRNPAKRQIGEQLWYCWLRNLPRHPSVRLGPPEQFTGADPKNEVQAEADSHSDRFILRVQRPALRTAPDPPGPIADWLEEGWQNPENDVVARESRTEETENSQARLVHFADEPKRAEHLARWTKHRAEWAQTERPARQAMRLFEELYEVYGKIQREEESLELVLGDGILSWRRPDGGIYHPVLLQRVQLNFDPAIPEFSVEEADRGTELYSGLFRSLADVDGKVVASCREELEARGFHPLGSDDTSGYLNGLVNRLSPRGEFLREDAPRGETEHPRIGRSAVLFLRKRTLGFAIALEGVLEDLVERQDLPPTLVGVVGVDSDEATDRSLEGDARPPLTDAVDEILFTKPANKEQMLIAEQLRGNPGVVVQGPPGTGKTHTIANLLGHLLAQGKKVLVTAHTTKALQVLREQVVGPLQPLCVSVLESDLESRKQLESSVQGIVQQLSAASAAQLDAQAEGIARHRADLRVKIERVRQALRDARANEYREIVIAGNGYAPSRAARIVAEGRGTDDWIPGPLAPGEPLPLLEEELVELYRTNAAVSADEEQQLSYALPSLSEVVPPDAFDLWLAERARLEACDRELGAHFWEPQTARFRAEDLEDLRRRLQSVEQSLADAQEWELDAIGAGHSCGANRQPWDSLCSAIQDVCEDAASSKEALLRHDPLPAQGMDLDEQEKVVGQIISHLEHRQGLNRLTLVLRGNWRRFISTATVNGTAPRTLEEFQALQCAMRLGRKRQDLKRRWDRQVAALGAPQSHDLGEAPEEACAQFAHRIQRCLAWYSEAWEPAKQELGDKGFSWDVFFAHQPPCLRRFGELLGLRDAVAALQPIIQARADRLRWNEVERKIASIRRALDGFGSDTACARVVTRLRKAVTELDSAAYREAFEELAGLHRRTDDLRKRHNSLAVLERAAPGWAGVIRSRVESHGGGQLPGKPHAAWTWRQLYEELERRAGTSYDELQAEADRLGDDFRRTTADLACKRAWAAQARRTTREQQQALVGWLNTIRRIGKRTGKRVPRLRAEANKRMSESGDAVPVWIMPLARVAENFDPRSTRFDVAIIDEASQSDVMAFLVFYLSKNVVVVGDHEQVSPSAVGQKLDEVAHLIDEHLQGIPNAALYDGQRSVYDVARESFGGTICLLEHFRCVPEIISFSNHLSYDGRILPLRDPSDVHLKPHVIPYRVDNASITDKVNPEEALAIASLVGAVIEQREYTGKSIGVISLVGEDQALEIERLLRRKVDTFELGQRRLVCGNAAHFQGDERDVMFLSLVDAAKEGPLSLRDTAVFKQRFNVAASRAKEQMWIVHSLNPETDLKPGDLRLRLIKHAQDPHAIDRELHSVEHKTESPLEEQVAGQLIEAGYRVIPQSRVGHYRIDLVVEGIESRLAVECDGDRHHPIEKLDEDMARQAVLERVGWKFVRIRGSQFFRDPDAAMRPIFQRLADLGIQPQGYAPAEERQDEAAGEELIDRVKRRAAQLRAEWAEGESPILPDIDFTEAGDTTRAVVPSDKSLPDSEPPTIQRRLALGAPTTPPGDTQGNAPVYHQGVDISEA